MNPTHSLEGTKVLIVEDNYMIASELAHELEAHGATVIGPVATVEEALSLIDEHAHEIDCASLDINLNGESAYAVADELAARNVPFIFSTGYDSRNLPKTYRSIPRCEKPVEPAAMVRLLATQAASA